VLHFSSTDVISDINVQHHGKTQAFHQKIFAATLWLPWPNGHSIWLEIRGAGVQIPVGVGPRHLWQPLTPGLPQNSKKSKLK